MFKFLTINFKSCTHETPFPSAVSLCVNLLNIIYPGDKHHYFSNHSKSHGARKNTVSLEIIACRLLKGN